LKALASLRFERSQEIFEEASRWAPGGVHSNARYLKPHPLYLSKARGANIYDADGNQYVDYFLGHGAVILGHAYPSVVEAIKRQVENGLGCGVESEIGAVEAVRLLVKMIPGAEMARFAVTGSQAVAHAIHIARAFTKRTKILKIEGGFHGSYDYTMVSTTRLNVDNAGPESSPAPVLDSEGPIEHDMLRSVLVVPFNRPEIMEQVVKKNRNDIAGILMEPAFFAAGCVLPNDGFLKAVREISEKYSIVLIFDEVISGFRMSPGGAQEYYGVKPDLTVFGKPIANGIPMSAIVGRRDLIEMTRPDGGRVAFSGTFNSYPISIGAAVATLKELKDGRVQAHLNHLNNKLVDGFSQIAEELHVKARIQALGGQFCIYFSDKEVTTFREARKAAGLQSFQRIQADLMNKGMYLIPKAPYHHSLCFSHSDADVERLLMGMEESLKNAPPL
jgi:glutamate-1-semialdehyde 2,1-aminomutase